MAGAGGAAAPPSRTKLFKSTDEGITWKEITGSGLPRAHRPHVDRRRDEHEQPAHVRHRQLRPVPLRRRRRNAGATWPRSDRRIANGQNGYNCGVYVDPSNPDIVYTINTSSFRSTDGGNTFTGFKGAPGGDDPQQMWIDPTDGQRMLLGVDQGATVSLDGGLTWSSWYNQATEQVYHISADNSFPYWVYATQQDAGAIATRSRGDLGTVNWLDWKPVPGYEFGYIVADPLNPKIVYSGGPGRGHREDHLPQRSSGSTSARTWTRASRCERSATSRWRSSATNPHELLVGFQYLMATTGRRRALEKAQPRSRISEGRDAAAAHGAAPAGRGGGARRRPVRRRPGGSIESFSTSSVAPGVIWVGTNNGLIKVTKDHGATWTDVTIPDLPNPTRADISTIDASHHDAARGVRRDRLPHGRATTRRIFYRTHDYGKTWTKIVNGLRRISRAEASRA